MIHGEFFSQICGVIPGIDDEERKIFASIPTRPFDASESAWSEQQLTFLKENRARVIDAMRETIGTQGRVGLNFKHAIVYLNAVELIPALVEAYNRTRADHDLLTVLMSLMRRQKYRPFQETAVYRTLFGAQDNYGSFILATPANEGVVTDHALRFHQSLRK